MDQRARIIAEAETWLRTPWRHGVEIRGVGVDCARFVKAAYVGAGQVPEFTLEPYPPDWMLHRDEERFLGVVIDHMDQVAQPRPADLAVWRYGRTFSHGAIVVEWPRIIHAYRPARMVCWGDAERDPMRDHQVVFYTPRGLS